MTKSNEKLVQNTLKTLSKDFVVVGKTRVQSWHAWLVIGVAVGIAAGVISVANRSSYIEMEFAQTPGRVLGERAWCFDFARDLQFGDRGENVLSLQRALNLEFGKRINETGVFGPNTFSGVAAFQEKYLEEILAPLGLKKGTGFVGKMTRAKLNALFGCRAEFMPNKVSPPSTN